MNFSYLSWLSTVAAGLLISSCGPDTNINGMFEPDGKKSSYESIMIRAEHAYNNGKYDSASSLVEQALAKSPSDEKAIVLKAYILLSQAGIDGFQLAEDLIAQSSASTSTSTSTTTSLTDTDTETDTAATCNEEEGAVKVLCQLQNIVGITAEDKILLTDPSTTDSSLTVPKSATEAREAAVNVIAKTNEAISTICSLVNEAAKLADDERHGACTTTTKTRTLQAKTHYLWAFAHLIEGVAFYAVYTDNLTSLEAKVTSISTSSPTEYIESLTSIAALTEEILPSSNTGSMLSAIYDDFDSTSLGFDQIPGMPSSITSSISDAIAQLRTRSESISSGDGEASAIKEQLTKKMTDQIANQLDTQPELKTDIQSDAEQKTEFCTAYGKISSKDTEFCTSNSNSNSNSKNKP